MVGYLIGILRRLPETKEEAFGKAFEVKGASQIRKTSLCGLRSFIRGFELIDQFEHQWYGCHCSNG